MDGTAWSAKLDLLRKDLFQHSGTMTDSVAGRDPRRSSAGQRATSHGALSAVRFGFRSRRVEARCQTGAPSRARARVPCGVRAPSWRGGGRRERGLAGTASFTWPGSSRSAKARPASQRRPSRTGVPDRVPIASCETIVHGFSSPRITRPTTLARTVSIGPAWAGGRTPWSKCSHPSAPANQLATILGGRPCPRPSWSGCTVPPGA